MQDARSTVLASLDGVAREGSRDDVTTGYEFSVTVEKLDGGEWAWVETENAAAIVGYDSGAQFYRISYEVDPRQLSANVEIVNDNRGAGIRFECGSGDCIRARGRRIEHFNGQQSFIDIDENRSSNIWIVDNPNRAQLLRDAAHQLIRGASGPPAPEPCATASPATQTTG
jgi:hypothetical protein